MKIRNAGAKPNKIEQQMAPMIDVVFQLLIFFMLTLKIVGPEGDFNIHMPIYGPDVIIDDMNPMQPVLVRLEAGKHGKLTRLQLGNVALGMHDSLFDPDLALVQLSNKVEGLHEKFQRVPGFGDPTIEIDADYELNYEYTIRAMSAVRGKRMPDGSVVQFVEKVKFAPPRQPKLNG